MIFAFGTYLRQNLRFSLCVRLGTHHSNARFFLDLHPNAKITYVRNVPAETGKSTFATCEVTGLEFKQRKGGVSLAPELPPTLNMRGLNPIASCSKASRGLFVQLREESIFTPLAISPSPSLRQLSTRYAIRAGRNSMLTPCHHDDQTIPSSCLPPLEVVPLHIDVRRNYSSHAQFR